MWGCIVGIYWGYTGDIDLAKIVGSFTKWLQNRCSPFHPSNGSSPKSPLEGTFAGMPWHFLVKAIVYPRTEIPQFILYYFIFISSYGQFEGENVALPVRQLGAQFTHWRWPFQGRLVAQDRKPETTTSQKAPLLTSKTRSLENSGWRIGSLTPGWGDGVGDAWGRRWCWYALILHGRVETTWKHLVK